MMKIEPSSVSIQLIFDHNGLEKLFSDFVTKKMGFPVRVQLGYDDEGQFPEAYLKDDSSYTLGQLQQLLEKFHLAPGYEGDPLEAASALIDMVLIPDIESKRDIQAWCQPIHEKRWWQEEKPEDFVVCVLVPYDYYENTLKQRFEKGWSV